MNSRFRRSPKTFCLDRDGTVLSERRVQVQAGKDLCVWEGRCAGLQYAMEALSMDFFVSDLDGGGHRTVLHRIPMPRDIAAMGELVIAPARNVVLGPDGFYAARANQP